MNDEHRQELLTRTADPADGVLRLALTGITKQYPMVRANDGVALAVAPG